MAAFNDYIQANFGGYGQHFEEDIGFDFDVPEQPEQPDMAIANAAITRMLRLPSELQAHILKKLASINEPSEPSPHYQYIDEYKGEFPPGYTEGLYESVHVSALDPNLNMFGFDEPTTTFMYRLKSWSGRMDRLNKWWRFNAENATWRLRTVYPPENVAMPVGFDRGTWVTADNLDFDPETDMLTYRYLAAWPISWHGHEYKHWWVVGYTPGIGWTVSNEEYPGVQFEYNYTLHVSGDVNVFHPFQVEALDTTDDEDDFVAEEYDPDYDPALDN